MCLYMCNTTNEIGKLMTFLSDSLTAHHPPIFISNETINRSAVYSCKALAPRETHHKNISQKSWTVLTLFQNTMHRFHPISKQTMNFACTDTG